MCSSGKASNGAGGQLSAGRTKLALVVMILAVMSGAHDGLRNQAALVGQVAQVDGMTGDEFLQHGAKLRQAQLGLRDEISQVERKGFHLRASYRRELLLRYEAVTEQLDALIREFLSGRG